MEPLEAEYERYLEIYKSGQRDDYTAGILQGLKIAVEILEKEFDQLARDYMSSQT